MTVSKTAKVYELIDKKAGSNEAMQGISGVFGFPFTLMTDAAVIFTHYGPMVNEIRAMYGRSSVSKDALLPVMKGASSEILSDLVFDKVIGQIPLVGILSNIMCAKAMTGKIGLLFAVLAATGKEATHEIVRKPVYCYLLLHFCLFFFICRYSNTYCFVFRKLFPFPFPSKRYGVLSMHSTPLAFTYLI